MTGIYLTQKEDKQSISESNRLEHATKKTLTCAGTQPETRLPVFRKSQYTLLFFLFFWFVFVCLFFNSSFNHIWTVQMKSEAEARSAKAACFPSL